MTLYITTAIDYVNAKPHVGHAYEKVLADVITRWHRLKGEDVYFLTGTDENAQKNEEAAKNAGMNTSAFVRQNSALFRKLCDSLQISYNDFIKTTEERHIKVSQQIFQTLFEMGDVYKGVYKGLYCRGCEAYFTEKDLIDGKCPEHQTAPNWIEQECYFFKLSKYKDKVLALLNNKSFVIPEGKRKEMIKRVQEEGMKDLCITRYQATWGIPVPFDQQHMIYVWGEALCNYVSALGYPNGDLYTKFWKNGKVIHVIGKGINWFHSVIWPAMLLALDVKMPESIVVHGYLTVNGQKMSKSLGTTIDPLDYIKKYGVDAVRYYLMREIPFGHDGDFSETALKARLNNELADDLGNLVSRTLAMVEKYFEGKIPDADVDGELVEKLDFKKIEKFMEKLEFHHALEEIWNFIHAVNSYINDNKPWENEKRRAEILYTSLEAIRIIGILISSFMPETAERINERLNARSGDFSEIEFGLLKSGRKVNKGRNLFSKIE